MDFSWIGVGSAIFMRPIAALVAALISMPGKTSISPAAFSSAFRPTISPVPDWFVAGAGCAGVSAFWRDFQHTEQYTGRSGWGRNGTLVLAPQSAHVASFWGDRLFCAR